MDVHESKEALRPPLGLSEKHNAAVSRKPRTKDVTSRYLSGISSPSLPTPQRCPSPSVSRTPSMLSTPASKRSQSAERRRPSTPSPPSVHSRPTTPSTPSRPITPRLSSRPPTPVQDGGVDLQNSSKRSVNGRTQEGLWPSTRGVSASLQLDDYALPTAKKERKVNVEALKLASNGVRAQVDNSARKTTPERRRAPLRGKNASDLAENSKPIDVSHSKSFDQHCWLSRNGGKLSANSLARSVDLTDKFRKPASLLPPSRGTSPIRKTKPQKFDSDGTQERYGDKTETSDRISSLSEDKPLQSGLSSPKLLSSRSFGGAATLSRPSRTLSSPFPVSQRPASPSKTLASSRGILSPSKTRPSNSVTSSLRSGTSTPIPSYPDLRKGKKISAIEDTHHLKLLYNRHLQWRFVNARAKTTLDSQAVTAEDLLYNAWNTTSQLRDSVSLKRIKLQQQKQIMKLTSVIQEQMAYLQDWVSLDRDHCLSLAGVNEALELCTLRLPVTGGARVNVQNVKDAVSCSVDVMQAMGSSISYLLPKVEKVNSLITELEDVTTRERFVLAQCADLLASLAMMQENDVSQVMTEIVENNVEESSLRANAMQSQEEAMDAKGAIRCSSL